MKKLTFFDAKPYDRASFEAVNNDYGFELTFLETRLQPETVDLARGADAVCLFVNDTVDRLIIDRLNEMDIRLIALRCAGYNNIDLKAVYENIHVVRVPAYSPYAVAEHAVALILSLNRKIHKAYTRVRDGNFAINGLMGFDLHGKTAGVIGTGQIGRCLIAILKGFGMTIYAFDPMPHSAYAREAGITYVDLPELYKKADIISLHCPLTPETHHIINDASIELMKKGVMLINTGRGKLVDTKALIAGLKTGKIGFAGLDVYEEESDYFFEDFSAELISDDVLARLLTFPNVLITSHQAFFTREAMNNIARTTLENVKEFFAGGYLKNEICYHCDKTCRKKKSQRCFDLNNEDNAS